MKKILFSAYSLDVGGIETALVTLLKYLVKDYDITLVLEKKQGIFLEDLPQKIKVLTYTPCSIKFGIIRKAVNFLKQLRFKIKYKNKFDFSADFATYSMPASFVARVASKNSAIWIHNNYMNFYNDDIKQYRKFFNSLKIQDFRKIVFVSDLDKKVFIAQFPELIKNTVVCNNLIDYKRIQKLADEKIPDEDLEKIFGKDYKNTIKNDASQNKIIKNDVSQNKTIKNDASQNKNIKKDDTNIYENKKIPIFINVGRHDEKQKKISRIIDATEKLNKNGFKFKVLLIGKGSNTKQYEQIIKEKHLDNIIMLGPKKNPYPYFKLSDCFILSSQFEGYPVVFIESQILELPIITTNVSDSKKDIDGKFGQVVENSEKGVYRGMKNFLEKGIKMQKFDPENFNNEITKKVKKIIED